MGAHVCSPPYPRSADERVVALLEHSPHALERGEICKALEWSRQRAGIVLVRLVDMGMLVCTPGSADGEGGRPAAVYSLPGRPVVHRNQRNALQPDSIVVTPTGKEARVLRLLLDDFVELELLGVPRAEAFVTLHARLVRIFQAGRDRPQPVRIETSAA